MLVKEESLCFERYEYKIKKGLLYKKIVMSIQIYPSSVSGCALPYMGDGLGSDTVNFDVGYEKLLAVKLAAIDSVSCMILEISGDGVVSNSVDVYVFPKLKDMEEIYSLLMKTKEEWHNRILQEEKEKRQLWQAKEQERAEVRKAQEKFFNDCYHFHDTNRKGPFYLLSQNELQFAGIYIDKQNNLNFLRIDGEAQQESNGVIPSNKIHYFEKAGNVHYTTDINGNYSNFGGSLTGGTFSKKAAFWGGLLLGKMGMEGGALFSHKPMESTMPETHISIKSEVRKIDDRNVVLNYYSDVLETYIDMELPADTYNFL